MGFIYKITNLVNGKVYIGQTRVSIKARFWQHKAQMNFDPYPIHRAMKKYGIDNFKVEQIEQCDNSLLNDREIYWIEQYQSANGTLGYNATKGGTHYSCRCKKPVDVYDLQCNYICSYESITKASNELKISNECIRECCVGTQHLAGNYIFAFKGQSPRPLPDTNKYKSVHQYDLEGNYIATYSSCNEAQRVNGYRSCMGITNCLNGKLVHSHGFMWSTEKHKKIPPYRKPYQSHDYAKKPIIAYKIDGSFKKWYRGIRECERDIGVKSQNISGVCRGIYKQMQGYIFRYADKEETQHVNA